MCFSLCVCMFQFLGSIYRNRDCFSILGDFDMMINRIVQFLIERYTLFIHAIFRKPEQAQSVVFS